MPAKARLVLSYLCIAFCSLVPEIPLKAQTISQAEYFFDVDPGPGNGIPITIAVPADPINFTATISAAGLPGGLHYLFVRTRTSAGRWSLYEGQEFYVRASIVKAEYFFDTDPGVGNGIPISIGAVSDTVNFNATLTTTGLPVGEHKVFVRTMDEKGLWSLYAMREFYILNPLVRAEYFFDTDPGVGNGTQLTIGTPADPVNFNAVINTTGLPVGEHKVFIRTQDEKNFWSLYEMREFYILNPLVKAEYFFDTDPGVGNGIPLTIGSPADPVNFNATLSTTGLPPGEHKVFIRTQDEKNFWSLYVMREFYVKPSVVAAEFFIDTDPGLGNGTPLVITPTLDSVSFSSVVTTPVLPFGTHFLFVRTMDTFGKWSLYEADTFQVGSPLPVELISFNAIKIAEGKVSTFWQTAVEINNDYFTVEKSANAVNFIPFATIEGAGNSNGILNYETIDHSPFTHISYYRLRQTDFNGNVNYSKVVAVKFSTNELYFILYPNPNNGLFDLSCEWKNAAVAEVNIIDNMGQLVYAKTFDVVSGHNRWRIAAPSFVKGLYLVQLQIGNNFSSHKFLIE